MLCTTGQVRHPCTTARCGSASPGRATLRESAAADRAPEPEDDQRTDHGCDPGAEIEELVDRIAETECLGEETPEQCADDAEHGRQDEADAFPAGHDRLRDHAREKPEDDPGDDRHLAVAIAALDDGRVLTTTAAVTCVPEPAPARPEDEREQEADDPDDHEDHADCGDIDARHLGGHRPRENGA